MYHKVIIMELKENYALVMAEGGQILRVHRLSFRQEQMQDILAISVMQSYVLLRLISTTNSTVRYTI